MAKVKNTTCTIETCEKPLRNRGYCATHYKRFLATGDPLRPCAGCGRDFDRRGNQEYCSDACKPPCEVAGCGRKLFSSGLCNTHYSHRAAGKHLGVIKEYGRVGCLFNGCSAPHAGKGYCSTHYGRLLKTGAVERDCPTCGVAMDGRKTYCSESCFPRCAANGCAEAATYADFGVCKNHSAGMYRYGRLPQYSWAKDKVCVICGAEHVNPKRRKVCSGKCQQRLYRATHAPEAKQREILQKIKQCSLCTEMIDLTVRHANGRKRRSDVKMCDSCQRAKHVRHRTSVTILAERDGVTCGICSEDVDMSLRFPDIFRASVDHIIPFAISGSHDPENLQLTHLWCNLVKSDRAGFTI